ncbi:MAG: DUF4037 domain-containing protein [Thermomicrobiales bacterium]
MDELTFVPGLTLSERFFEHAVRPIVERSFPRLTYSAALIGHGSDVLGFDTARSKDHEWGPRCLLFVNEEVFQRHVERIEETLRQHLPVAIDGIPTNFGPTGEAGIARLQAIATGPVDHRVRITTVARFVQDRLGWIDTASPGLIDWLLASDERLLELTAGAVFHDGLAALGPLRTRLSYFPDQICRYILASQWQRISQKEAFVGRTGEVGDELGSAMVAGMLVRDLMRLAFLMERTYAPYEKWFGSAFARLKLASDLEPSLTATLASRTWREREAHLGTAYKYLAREHNALGITEPISPELRPYHQRPYRVLHAERFAEAIQATITDPELLALPPYIGSIDQFIDSTDLLTHHARRGRLAGVYAGHP